MKNTSSSLRLATATAASVAMLGVVSAAQATLIAYDGFTGDTPGTSLSANSASEGTGWSSGWSAYSTDPQAVVSSTALTYNGSSYGNDVQMQRDANSNNAYDFRSLSTSLTPGNTYWLSFLVSGVVTNATAFDAISLYDGSGAPTSGSTDGVSTGQVLSFGSINNSGQFGIQYVTSSKSNGTYPSSDAASSASAVNQLVLELDYTGGSTSAVYLYLNPTSQPSHSSAIVSGTGITLQDFEANTNPTITQVRLGANAGNGSPVEFDEIEVGTTFADVVPEPSTLAMLAIPGLAILHRRRRASVL